MLSGLRQLAIRSVIEATISNTIMVTLLVAFSEQCNKGKPFILAYHESVGGGAGLSKERRAKVRLPRCLRPRLARGSAASVGRGVR